MDMKEVKAAAELALLNAHCFDEEAQAVFRFAILAIPVVEAAERAHGIKSGGTMFDRENAYADLRTALAKLRDA